MALLIKEKRRAAARPKVFLVQVFERCAEKTWGPG